MAHVDPVLIGKIAQAVAAAMAAKYLITDRRELELITREAAIGAVRGLRLRPPLSRSLPWLDSPDDHSESS